MRISILRADIVQRVLWEHPQDWWRRVHRQRLLRLERDFRVWRQGALANQARLPAELHAVMELGAFLSQELARINIRLARLYRQRAEFNRYHQRAGTALEREHPMPVHWELPRVNCVLIVLRSMNGSISMLLMIAVTAVSEKRSCC